MNAKIFTTGTCFYFYKGKASLLTVSRIARVGLNISFDAFAA